MWYTRNEHLVLETSSTSGCWLQQAKGLNLLLLKEEAKSITCLMAREEKAKNVFDCLADPGFVMQMTAHKLHLSEQSLWGWRSLGDASLTVGEKDR